MIVVVDVVCQCRGSESLRSAVRTVSQVDPNAPANPLGWGGEYADPTGLSHLRARQYDPTTGAFTTPDPASTTPVSATYGYASANPLVFTDPLGLWSWRGVIETINHAAGAVSGATGIAAVGLGATGIGLPAAAVLGAVSVSAGAVTAGTSAYLAYDICTTSTGKGPCGNAIALAALDTATLGRAGAVGGLTRRGIRASEDAFRHGYRYHPRIRQRGVEDPAHQFPYSFDDAILKETPTVQADGSLLYRKVGSVNGKARVYEIAVTPETGIIFHRQWRGK